MIEVWKAVPGFEGIYEVSDQGRVRSLGRTVQYSGPTKSAYSRWMPGRVLRPGRMSGGHLSVMLGRAAGSFCVHTLVASAFIGPRPSGLEVRHLNGCPTDNRLENLQYATRTRNSQDKKYHRGAKSYKLSPQQAAAIKAAVDYTTGVALAARFGVSKSTVYAIKAGVFHKDVDPAL